MDTPVPFLSGTARYAGMGHSTLRDPGMGLGKYGHAAPRRRAIVEISY
jgi:hypothetical protein